MERERARVPGSTATADPGSAGKPHPLGPARRVVLVIVLFAVLASYVNPPSTSSTPGGAPTTSAAAPQLSQEHGQLAPRPHRSRTPDAAAEAARRLGMIVAGERSYVIKTSPLSPGVRGPPGDRGRRRSSPHRPASARSTRAPTWRGAELGLVCAALAFGAYRVRAPLLPGWTGAPARLAEVVLAVSGLIWVSEALGTFGGFEAGAVLGGGGGGRGGRADRAPGRLGRPRPAAAPPAPAPSGLATWSRWGPAPGLAAGWMVPTLGTLAAGMDRADSLWYHMPLAAKFVQTGYLGHIYFFDPIFLASFYPANSEVVTRSRCCSSTATSSRP